MPYLVALIVLLSVLFLSRLYRRHFRAENDGRNRLDRAESAIRRQRDYICSLESEIRRRDCYIQELQRRCGRRRVRLLPGPNFSDYEQYKGGVAYYGYRVWWN